MIGRVISTALRRATPLLLPRTRSLWTTTLTRSTKRVFKPCTATIPKYFSTDGVEIDWSDDLFQDIVDNNKIVVFMKGTPEAPQCGFSKYTCQILSMHGVHEYLTFNVLDDEVLRARVKEFSSWPTIPQVYMNGEFIGGFDILLQLHQSGEIIEELEKIGHRSSLIDDSGKDDS